MARLLAGRIPFSEFAGQYLIGNLISAVAAIIAGIVFFGLTGSHLTTALVATVANDIVWYIYILAYDLRHGDVFSVAIKHIVSDFGLAEGLDSLLVRPGLFYLMPILTHAQASGILIATLIADVVYTLIALRQQRKRSSL